MALLSFIYMQTTTTTVRQPTNQRTWINLFNLIAMSGHINLPGWVVTHNRIKYQKESRKGNERCGTYIRDKSVEPSRGCKILWPWQWWNSGELNARHERHCRWVFGWKCRIHMKTRSVVHWWNRYVRYRWGFIQFCCAVMIIYIKIFVSCLRAK